MHKEFQRVQYIKVEKEDKFFSSIAKKYKGRYYKNLKQGAGWSFPFEYKEQIDQQRMEFMSKGTIVEKSSVAETLEVKAPIAETETVKAPIAETETVKVPIAETETVKEPIAETLEVKATIAETETVKATIAETETVKAPIAETVEVKAPIAETETVKATIAETETVKAPIAETETVKEGSVQAKIKPIVEKTFENKQKIATSIKPKVKAPISYTKVSKPTQTDLENHKYKYDLPDSYKSHFVFYKNLIQRTN